MSKSLRNSTTVDDGLETVRPQVLRYALGAGHYRSALEWSAATLPDAEAAYGRIETFVRNAGEAVQGIEPGEPAVAWEDFAAALDDDLGVPQALAVVHSGVRAGNALLAVRDLPALAATLAVVRRMLGVLALDPVEQWPEAGGAQLTGVVDALVQIAVEARADARARKDWERADAVRDSLKASGIVLEDTMVDGVPGVRWRLA